MTNIDETISLPEVQEHKRAGAKITLGENSPAFQEFLKRHGLDKQQWLAIAEKGNQSFSQQMYKKAKALDILRKETEAIIDLWNSTDARGITVYEDLIKLSIDIQERRMRKEAEDPLYDPLEDKVLQKALERKQQMILALDKLKIDVHRAVSEDKAREQKNSGKVIDATTATVEDLDETTHN